MMDTRAAKLALARQKLRSHQEKKFLNVVKVDNPDELQQVDVRSGGMRDDPDPDPGTGRENKPDSVSFQPQEVNNKSCLMESTNSHINLQNADVNITEILISSKRNLEVQVSDLQSKLSQLESNYTLAMNNNSYCKQKTNILEQELKIIQDKYLIASQELISKDKLIAELHSVKSSIVDENNNLQEQLELTKSVLTVKEAENASLQSQLHKLQNELDATQLQMQQLTNGTSRNITQYNKNFEQSPEVLLQKISCLEEQLKSLQKERDQINSHYEHYVGELNEQLKTTIAKNQQLSVEVQNLYMRENNLVQQISDMEIRIQNMKQQPYEDRSEPMQSNEVNELQGKYDNLQVQFKELCNKFENLQRIYAQSEAKVKELNEAKDSECEHYDNISMTKLNADIASDKVAAQRATEQNRKLKTDLQELEEAFVKISRDKLELTEKLSAEKYLNRELTIKLAEIHENAKDMHIKLHAKDEEMIRLQQNYRELERKFEFFCESVKSIQTSHILSNSENCEHDETNDVAITGDNNHSDTECQCLIEYSNSSDGAKIPKEDAMLKLQDRFLKIMEEVADLSDEKHRLEHIILQLQNETDTICEYVALYQQQRSLLKKRDEERSTQIKIFQDQCDLLKSQLEELSAIIIRLAQDTELAAHFLVEPRQSDLNKVLHLLSNLKSNTLVDPHKISSELKNFYPCSCCSGKLIDV